MRYATSPVTLALFVVMLLGLVGAGGCAHSADRHVFESTWAQPTNVAVIDTAQDRVLWRMEVPVDHKVQLDFDRTGMEREATRVSALPATSMSWKLYATARPHEDPNLRVGQSVAKGEVQLTGNPVRMRIDYRDTTAVTGDGPFRIEQYRAPEGVRSGQRPTTQTTAQDGAQAPDTERPAAIVGKWNVRGEPGGHLAGITFRDDGTVLATEVEDDGPERVLIGRYQIEGDTLIVDFADRPTERVTYELRDDVLILHEEGAEPVTFERVPFERR